VNRRHCIVEIRNTVSSLRELMAESFNASNCGAYDAEISW
jgi:hypothetical protein